MAKLLGEPVKTLVRDGNEWLVNDSWRAPWLVGAGGHFCPVARLLGKGPGSHEVAVAAKEVEFHLDAAQQAQCGVEGDCPELWFCRDLKGYAWVFRKGDYLNIGLGREDNHHLSDYLAEFVLMMQDRGRLPPGLPLHYKGHAYLLYGHAERPLTGDGVLLIGDAAGLAYTQSGEGIRPAVESALLAAEVLSRTPAENAAARYETALKARFGPRGDQARQGWQVPEMIKTRVAASLMKNPWFTRHVVTDRWFLHTKTPALPASGVA